MSDNPVLFEIRDNIAHVTLNRPHAGNALDLAMAQELAAASLECESNRDVRAVLLSGAGNSFCVGGDVKAFAVQKDLPRYLREITSHLHLAVSRLARLDAPVIAAVQGAAAGGGFSLAISCDLVLAAESATFLMAYSKIGMAPDGGSTYFLPRLVGFKRAMELTLTNRVLSAGEACEWGMVTEVLPADASRARRTARPIAGPGPDRGFRLSQAPAAQRMGPVTGDADGAGEPCDRGSRRHGGWERRDQGVCGEKESEVRREINLISPRRR